MTFENPAPEITEINNVHPFSADVVSKYNVQLQAKLLTFTGNFSILQLETPLSHCNFARSVFAVPFAIKDAIS